MVDYRKIVESLKGSSVIPLNPPDFTVEDFHLTTDGEVVFPMGFMHLYTFRDIYGEEEYQKLLARPRVASPYPEDSNGRR